MKRFHVHVAVNDLQQNIRFYSSIFGAQPAVVKDDYAKWMLDDPYINFAISTHGDKPGINHLGIQVDSDEALAGMQSQLSEAGALSEEKGIACCYARSDKYWVTDPQGMAWETYHTLGTVEVFSEEAGPLSQEGTAGATAVASSACCAPAAKAAQVTSAAGCCAPAIEASQATACCAPTAARAKSAACCAPSKATA